MNWDQIEGGWKQMKGTIREQWGKLTDDEFDIIAGQRDKLVGVIQERYGYSREAAEAEVQRLEARFPDEPRH
jgi:uncharacterized protein YjbJ (UPF0337 family)